MTEGNATAHIGRRIREIRTWRKLSIKELAELAGFSESYLSRIEHGDRPVQQRSTLEAFAAALKVAPSELGAQPLSSQVTDPEIGRAQSRLTNVEEALTDVGFGDIAVTPRPWSEVTADLRKLNEELRPRRRGLGPGRPRPLQPTTHHD